MLVKCCEIASRPLFPSVKMGRKAKRPTTDIANPPMVPAAKGNQKASLPVPTMKGTKPRMVDTTVRKTGTTLAFHALTKARAAANFGKRRRTALYSFSM